MTKVFLLSTVLIVTFLTSSAKAYNLDDVRRLLRTNSCPRCDLSGADLRAVNLKNADLTGANLYGANLSGANLDYANLIDADLRSAITQGTSMIGIYRSRATRF
jgi:uncharacterized protein YjbI with pentapeptide repeats